MSTLAIKRIAKITLLVTAILFCLIMVVLLGAEVYLRIAGIRFYLPCMCELIEDRGCILYPDLNVTAYVDGRPFKIVTNSKGLRERESPYAKPPVVTRIIGMGDSVAFGARVEAHETYTSRLDRMFQTNYPNVVEVINAASMYTRAQEEQLNFYLDEVYKYNGALVMLQFTSKGDLMGNERQEYWRVENGLIKRIHWEPTPYMQLVKRSESWPGYDFLINHSYLFNVFRFFVWNIFYREKAHRSEHYGLPTELLLKQFKIETGKRGAKLLVIVMPLKQNLEYFKKHGKWPDHTDEYRIKEMCEKHNIRMFNLTEPLSKVADIDEVIFEEGHPKPKGHLLAAKALYPILEEMVFESNKKRRIDVNNADQE